MGEVGKSKHVQSPQQALAISYDIKRRAKHQRGGKVKGYDTGGATDPVSAVVSALQAGSNQVASPGSNPGMNATTPSPASFAAAAPAGVTSPTPTPTQNPAGVNAAPANTGLGSSNPIMQSTATNNNSFMAPQNVTAGVGAQPQNNMQLVNGMMQANPAGMAAGGMAGVGQMPWFAKAEARNLVHSGPIMSAVPGRTDRHNMNLASGSYVLPSAAVAHLGQQNTMAGMKVLTNMLGGGGPKIGQGMGAPKPPHMMGIPGDRGGARGERNGNIVPVITAGGEYVVTPEQVARLGDGDVKFGHRILDAWVQHLHKDAAKTIKNLPPPAKS